MPDRTLWAAQLNIHVRRANNEIVQMVSENVISGLFNIFMGVLIIAINIPLLKEKNGRNYWYGIWIKKSLESEENWDKINKYGAQRFIFWAMVPIITGILTLLIPTGETGSALLAIFVPLVFIVIIPIIEILRFAKKL